MAASIIERYERILHADPKSRVFVELARALLERGEPERAIDLCERGIEHHPDSVVARIVWGKALLAIGRVDEAVRRFEAAVAIEPQNPYGYDLAGEALVRGGQPEHARALLERGAAAHPHDARIQLWLTEAATDRPANGAPQPVAPPRADSAQTDTAPDASASPQPSHIGADTPADAPTPRLEGAPRPPPLARPPGVSVPPPVHPGAGPSLPATAGDRRGLADVLALLPDEGVAPARAEAPDERAAAPVPGSSTPTEAGGMDARADERPSNGAADVAGVAPAAVAADAGAGPEHGDGRETTLAIAPDGAPAEGDLGREPAKAPDGPSAPAAAAREAPDTTSYEAELRKELLAAHPPAGGSPRRHLRAIAGATLIVAVLAGAATYLVVKARHRESDAHAAAEAARKGLARDTLGSLREARRVLVEARRGAPASADIASTLAEVDAVLAHDFDDADARADARALVDSSAAGPGTFAARWLIAATPRDREAAAISLLERRDATPLTSVVAGEVLLARREGEAARAALDAASRATPPMLRAVTLLGDMDAAADDPAAALERYRAVLRVQPTHPRAAMGAGEASLALARDLDTALRALDAVAADARSAPPVQDRLRFDLVRARLLAAAGRGAEAVHALDDTEARHGARPEIAAARAEALASAGDVAGGLAAAEAARRAAPGDGRYREQVARLQLRLGRFRELLAGTEGDARRTLRTWRGIARIELGEPAAARAELEATRRDGKMTPEAAAWMAIADIASGRQAHAASVVDALIAAPAPHPVALLARARLDLAAGRAEAAEQRLRAAIDGDPDLLDARYELGRLLIEGGRAGDAREVLEKAVARAPWRASGRVALARARLATGDRETAIRELEAVVSERPDDPGALDAARRMLRAARGR